MLCLLPKGTCCCWISDEPRRFCHIYFTKTNHCDGNVYSFAHAAGVEEYTQSRENTYSLQYYDDCSPLLLLSLKNSSREAPCFNCTIVKFMLFEDKIPSLRTVMEPRANYDGFNNQQRMRKLPSKRISGWVEQWLSA